MAKTIFIDWDDTLVHNRKTVQAFKDAKQYHAIMREAGLVVPENLSEIIQSTETEYETLKPSEKIRKGKFYEILCSKLDIEASSNNTYLLLDDLYNQRYAQLTNFLPGAKEFLQTLQKNFQLVLISDGYTERVNAQLRHLGLERMFTDAFHSDKYGFKVEGKIFDEARKLCSGGKKPIYIGDNPEIDALATDHGFDVMLVNNGYSNYTQLPSNLTVLTFDQIIERLDR